MIIAVDLLHLSCLLFLLFIIVLYFSSSNSRLFGESFNLFEFAGVVHSHMGNHSGAVEAYTYSIANNPYNVKALFNSAAIFEVLFCFA